MIIGWTGILIIIALQRIWAAQLFARNAIFAALAVMFFIGGWRRRNTLRSPEHRSVTVGFLALSVAVATIAAVTDGEGPAVIKDFLFVAMLGWSLVLWLPFAEGEETRTNEIPRALMAPALWWMLTLLAVVFALLALRHQAMMGPFAILQDEILYLLQSRWLTEPRFSWRLDPELLPFLRPEYTFYRAPYLTTQYPPGWPLILALFSGAGMRWWSTVIVATICIALTYLIARRLHSPMAGLIAAAVLATQQLFLDETVGYMSHIAAMTLSAAAAHMLLLGEDAGGRKRASLCLIAGFLMGAAVTVRPLTGFTLGLSFGLWMLIRRRLASMAVAESAGIVAVGALAPLVALLYYNNTTTGAPLLFGYNAAHGSLHDLGFGVRGYNFMYGPAFSDFTIGDAVDHLVHNLWVVASEALPFFLLIPVLWLGRVHRYEIRWWTIAVFLILPAAYFFYFYTAIRLYSELLPFLAIGISLLLMQVSRDDWRVAGRSLIALILLTSVAKAASWRHGDQGKGRDTVVPNAELLVETARKHGRIVVFLEDPSPEAYLFRRLSLFNSEGLESDIVVARGLGSADTALIRRLPEHVAFRGAWRQGQGLMKLTPLSAAER